MTELDAALAAIDAYIKANPSPTVLEQWRQLRGYIAALDDQRYVYLAIGVAIGILGSIVVAFICGGIHWRHTPMIVAATVDRLRALATRNRATRDDLPDLAYATDVLDWARRADGALEILAAVMMVLCAQLERLGDGLEEHVPLVDAHRRAITRAVCLVVGETAQPL